MEGTKEGDAIDLWLSDQEMTERLEDIDLDVPDVLVDAPLLELELTFVSDRDRCVEGVGWWQPGRHCMIGTCRLPDGTEGDAAFGPEPNDPVAELLCATLPILESPWVLLVTLAGLRRRRHHGDG